MNKIIINNDSEKENYMKLASFLRDFQLASFKDQNKCIFQILRCCTNYELRKHNER